MSPTSVMTSPKGSAILVDESDSTSSSHSGNERRGRVLGWPGPVGTYGLTGPHDLAALCCRLVSHSAGTLTGWRNSARDWRRIWNAEDRNSPAINAATMRSGHLDAVSHTAPAATITATLPMASLREQSQTDRTLASPSLYFISNSTLRMFAARARKPIAPINSARGTPRTST